MRFLSLRIALKRRRKSWSTDAERAQKKSRPPDYDGSALGGLSNVFEMSEFQRRDFHCGAIA
jgi:hypothetical protein